VLRFRNQQLDDNALVAFSRQFSELDMAPTPAAGERMVMMLPEIAVISNIVVGGKAVGSLGNSELVWHQDMSYNELPPKASLLYGIETPSAGGETFFKPIAYSVSKSALYNLTRYLATYWAKSGVRVNTLTLAGVWNGQPQEFLDAYTARMPLGRMAEASEVVGPVVFLSSDASSYVTGANVVVDGGWSAW